MREKPLKIRLLFIAEWRRLNGTLEDAISYMFTFLSDIYACLREVEKIKGRGIEISAMELV